MGCASSDLSGAKIVKNEDVSMDFHDKYFLGEKLGRGAFAQVRAAKRCDQSAFSSGDGTQAFMVSAERAVKVLSLSDSVITPRGRQVGKIEFDARKEIDVWKAIGCHTNCVRLQDTFFSNDFCYMVMERCSCSLTNALDIMPELNERHLGIVFGQMLAGIAHCHSVQVVHRDIKPDNFLVMDSVNGQVVKLADFGLSVTMPKSGCLSGILGTARYMSPEMLAGKSYDEKIDVWAFGVIVYVLLFGQFPYVPKEQIPKAIKQAIREGRYLPTFEPMPAASGSEVRSDSAVEFVKSLLQRNPETRPRAEHCINMKWMATSRQNNHMPDANLPSLQPMLSAAKKLGAFEAPRVIRQETTDELLNMLQMQRHGKPLPDVGCPSKQMIRSPSKELSRSTSKEDQSISTTAGRTDSRGSGNTIESINTNTGSDNGRLADGRTSIGGRLDDVHALLGRIDSHLSSEDKERHLAEVHYTLMKAGKVDSRASTADKKRRLEEIHSMLATVESIACRHSGDEKDGPCRKSCGEKEARIEELRSVLVGRIIGT